MRIGYLLLGLTLAATARAQSLVAAVHDFVESPAEGSLYVEAARAAGDKAEQRVIRNASRFEYLSPQSVAWPVVREAVFDLIKQPSP